MNNANASDMMPASHAMIVSLLTASVAISSASLGTGEALIALTLLSLDLWRGLYVTGFWLAAALLSQ